MSWQRAQEKPTDDRPVRESRVHYHNGSPVYRSVVGENSAFELEVTYDENNSSTDLPVSNMDEILLLVKTSG